MLSYIIKRILLFLPTLLLISIINFFISINTPGDPVKSLLTGADKMQSKSAYDNTSYNELKEQLGLNLPIFYFSITSLPVPDTLYKISDVNQKNTLRRLAITYGNWNIISNYFLSIKKLETDANQQGFIDIVIVCQNLLSQYNKKDIENSIEALSQKKHESLNQQVIDIRESYTKVVEEKNIYQKYIPALHWYGFKNQYHQWISNFLSGNFGYSYQDKNPVSSKVYRAFKQTFILSIIAMVISFTIGIPLGIYVATNKNRFSAKIINTVLFSFYSLPTIWVASMLLIFLCEGDYLSWFHAPGALPISDDASFWYTLSENMLRYTLPLICWIYGSLAYINKQMQSAMVDTLTNNFIQTARAKGMSKKEIIKRHALKNSLLPLITLAGHLLPIMLSGSFVIETVFQLPGMGKLTMDAFMARDYPVIFSIIMLTATLILLGNLLADIIYALLDPRITFRKSMDLI